MEEREHLLDHFKLEFNQISLMLFLLLNFMSYQQQFMSQLLFGTKLSSYMEEKSPSVRVGIHARN